MQSDPPLSTVPSPNKAFQPGEQIAVLLPLPLVGAYDYRVGAEQCLKAGDFVRVPLGRRHAIGVVWGPGRGDVAPERCRDVLERLAAPALPEALRRLVDWVASYTLAAPGAVLKMAMSVPEALEAPRAHAIYGAAIVVPAGLRLTDARRRVLDAATRPASIADLARAADVGPAVVRGLVAAGALTVKDGAPPIGETAFCEADFSGAGLSDEQARAADRLRARIGSGFSVTMLEGVTGSGKTEVYFEAIAAALSQGLQVLVLLPEIALSAQWLERYTARFSLPPLAWHSDIGDAARRNGWRAVAEGRAKVVAGARSALFLPFARLGLIIVDEEHDGSYKQEEGVAYHARDMAVVRARLGEIPIVLASATPSLETRANVQAGRYELVHLPNRHGGAELPELTLVDLRKHPPTRQSWLSPPLIAAMEETLAAKEQVLLFLNRRGYAPLTLCRTCGHRLQCPHCTAWLVEHRARGRLQCHHCGYLAHVPTVCPGCEAADSFIACGPGVERVAEEAAKRFPEARLAVMASDSLSGPKAAADIVERMARHEIDLLVGTQIVAKGHHFPRLTLVGVVDADLGLAGGDLRAAERTFQLLTQVAGRAGRAAHPGRVFLQTFQPDAPVLAALVAGDTESFYAAEAESRRVTGMPPYGKLAAVIVSGPDGPVVEKVARDLARTAPRAPGVSVLGPAPAPLALLRGRYRHRLLVKAERRINLQALLRHWLSAAPTASGVRIQVDVDPYSFL